VNSVAVAADFLNIIGYKRHGYLQLGICLALPKVLTQWSIFFFCMGLLFVALEVHQFRMGFFYAEIATTVPLITILVFQRRLSPQRLGESMNTYQKGFPGVQTSKSYAQKAGSAIRRSTTSMMTSAKRTLPFNVSKKHHQQSEDNEFNSIRKSTEDSISSHAEKSAPAIEAY